MSGYNDYEKLFIEVIQAVSRQRQVVAEKVRMVEEDPQTDMRENFMEYVVNKVDLCDPAQEPSDEDLERLMDCVALEATKRKEKAARSLNAEIDREIAKTIDRLP